MADLDVVNDLTDLNDSDFDGAIFIAALDRSTDVWRHVTGAEIKALIRDGRLSSADVSTAIQTALEQSVQGNTETGITVTYDNGKLNFVIAGPTPPTHATLLGGSSADSIPVASELTITGSNGQLTFAPWTGTRHMLIARLASEPDITSVVFSTAMGFNQVGAFTKHSSTVTVSGEDYSVWVSNQLLTRTTTTTATVS